MRLQLAGFVDKLSTFTTVDIFTCLIVPMHVCCSFADKWDCKVVSFVRAFVRNENIFSVTWII